MPSQSPGTPKVALRAWSWRFRLLPRGSFLSRKRTSASRAPALENPEGRQLTCDRLVSQGGDVPIRLRADFNGLFGDVLCLSHTDSSTDDTGARVVLQGGMEVIAFEEDLDDHGQRDNLVASGWVEPAPDWLRCKGSRWVLKIDEQGVRHESELRQRVDDS